MLASEQQIAKIIRSRDNPDREVSGGTFNPAMDKIVDHINVSRDLEISEENMIVEFRSLSIDAQ